MRLDRAKVFEDDLICGESCEQVEEHREAEV